MSVSRLLLFNTSMQQASFQATALEEKAEILAAQEQSLKMDLETLRDPQRVAVEARKIGMVPPANPAFLRLSDGKVLGTPTAALPTDAVRVSPLPTRKPKDLRPAVVVVPAPEDAADSAEGESESAEETQEQTDGAADSSGGDAAGTKKHADRAGRTAGGQGRGR